MQLLLYCAAIAVLSTTVAFASDVAGQFNYAVLASNKIEIGEPYKIGFGVSGGNGIKSVSANVITENARQGYRNISVKSAESVSAGKGDWTELELQLTEDPSVYDLQAEYKLSIRIEDMSGRVFTNDTKISIIRPQQLLLIQTDKGVYQPGQAVHYRIVTLDKGLKAALADTRVEIRDSRRNLLYSNWHNASDDSSPAGSSSRAISEGSLPLSELPIEGKWSIEATNDYGSERKYFEVRRYVLPKFTLDVQLPKFVHFNDSGFKIGVTVKYTFDKAVEGKLKVKFGPFNTCRRCKPRYDLQKTIEADAVQKEQQFAFDLNEWREMLSEDEMWQPGTKSSYNVRCQVEFTEKFTGVKKSVKRDFTIYTKKYSVEIKANAVQFFLPGGQVPIAVTLIRPDNEPFTESTDRQLTITLKYSRRGKRQTKQIYSGLMSAASTGTGASLMATVPADADFQKLQFVASVNTAKQTTNSVTIVPYMAYSDEYVSADFVNDNGKVIVNAKKSSGIMFRMMATMSRDQLQSWQQMEAGNSDRVQLFDSDCSQCKDLLPEVTAVVIGVTGRGEIIASAASENLGRYLANLTLSSNLTDNKGQPQQYASIKVQAEPNSLIFLAGIDHSVNLLRKSNDILRSSVLAGRPSLLRHGPWGYKPSSVNTKRVLSAANLILMSDGFYYNEEEVSNGYFGGGRGRVAADAGLSSTRRKLSPEYLAPASGAESAEQSQPRQFFPETMIWSMVETDNTGQAHHSVKLPDTITSWDITAFGLNNQSPIQTMPEPMSIITQKQFFVRPILPVSIIRGEKFILKVLTYNYLAEGAAVNVTLKLNKAFTATAMANQKSWSTDRAVGVEVAASEKQSIGAAAFVIVARELQMMPLEIIGQVTVGDGDAAEAIVTKDIVLRSLLVLPEGITVRRSAAMLIGLDGVDSTSQSVAIDYPNANEIVPGSEALSYSLIGDVLGPAMQNVGQLIGMPSGCGEQNLVKFAPAVSVARYLTAVGADERVIMQKAVRAMQTGLQRQLTFRRTRDASYSAFGDRDEVGSVWLTAFTLATYARASEFITMDGFALSGSSLQFLLQAQHDNGKFQEMPGAKVFDQSLQGEAGRANLAMTAFVCSAIVDVQAIVSAKPQLQSSIWKESDVVGAITKCLWYLQAAADGSEELDAAVDVASAAYAMARIRDELPQLCGARCDAALANFRRRLAEMAVVKDGAKYWLRAGWWKTGSVEASAYAMMGGLLVDEDEELVRPDFELLTWIVGQQQQMGGFGSTQSTVMAIRALSEFATKFNIGAASDNSAEVVVSNSNASLSRTFTVNSDNRYILQSVLLGRGQSARLPELMAVANGNGSVLINVAWQYNVIGQDGKQLGADWLMAKNGLKLKLGDKAPTVDTATDVAFTVCASASANITSGMYILTITDPTGYSPVQHSPIGAPAALKRVELDDAKVVFYFEQLTDPLCVFAKWQRNVPMLDTAPQTVTLQKYYEPALKLSATYSAPELAGVTQCGACADCPGCAVELPVMN